MLALSSWSSPVPLGTLAVDKTKMKYIWLNSIHSDSPPKYERRRLSRLRNPGRIDDYTECVVRALRSISLEVDMETHSVHRRGMLHDPQVYPEPGKFSPERFEGLDKARADETDPRHLVFGFGRRSVDL